MVKSVPGTQAGPQTVSGERRQGERRGEAGEGVWAALAGHS